MNLSPEIIDAIGKQYEAMGFGFNPQGLSRYAADGVDMIDAAAALGLSPQQIADLLIQKFTVAEIEIGLPKCIRQVGDDAALISMPLDDLRFVYGYIALVAAGAPIKLDQTKRAIAIAHKLMATANAA